MATRTTKPLSRDSGEPPNRRNAQLDALDWIPDVVVLSDARGSIVFTNQSTERMTGRRRSELIGSPIVVLVPERVRKREPATSP